MPFADNQGIRIHYEVEGAGPPLVMQHGSFGSLIDWRDNGYTTALKNDYRLILIDLRGHGASDKPHDPAAYDITSFTADIVAVLDALNISRAHYLGYSLGGWIGFGLAKFAPDRVLSLSLGGAHPFFENVQPLRDLLSGDTESYIEAVSAAFGSHMTPALRTRMLANDTRALHAVLGDRPELAEVLPAMRMPVLLYAGEADPRLPKVRECLDHIANATFFSLPECGHIAAFSRSELVLPHLKNFLGTPRT